MRDLMYKIILGYFIKVIMSKLLIKWQLKSQSIKIRLHFILLRIR